MIKKVKLESLSTEELRTGAVYSLANSFDLYHEGTILEFLGRMSRAYTLIQLSIEEAGKAIMLFELAQLKAWGNALGIKDLTKYKATLNKVEEAFFNHKGKTLRSLAFIVEFLGMYCTDPLNGEINSCLSEFQINSNKGYVTKLDELKNLSLYVSNTATGFQHPSQKITSDTYSALQSNAIPVLTYAQDVVFKDSDFLEKLGFNASELKNLKLNTETRRLQSSLDLENYFNNQLIN